MIVAGPLKLVAPLWLIRGLTEFGASRGLELMTLPYGIKADRL